MDDATIYKMELDGTIVGKFGKAGKQLKEFGIVHEMDCRKENEVYRWRNFQLAGAETHAEAAVASVEEIIRRRPKAMRRSARDSPNRVLCRIFRE